MSPTCRVFRTRALGPFIMYECRQCRRVKMFDPLGVRQEYQKGLMLEKNVVKFKKVTYQAKNRTLLRYFEWSQECISFTMIYWYVYFFSLSKKIPPIFLCVPTYIPVENVVQMVLGGRGLKMSSYPQGLSPRLYSTSTLQSTSVGLF